MHYTYENPVDCKHSKGRNLPKFGKDTLAVYATCKSPHKRESYRQHFLDSYHLCESCPDCTLK